MTPLVGATLAALTASLAASGSLAGVVHADLAKGLPAAARARLAAGGSVVVTGRERHFFALYDRNVYEGVPSFVSVDALLHVFHVRFDRLIADAEIERAVPALHAFALGQARRARDLWRAQPSERLRRLALYHATALALADDFLSPSVSGPESQGEQPPYLEGGLRPDVEATVQALRQARAGASSPACPLGLDASLFTPRGHYAGYRLAPYFRAFTFYGQCGFDLGQVEGRERAADVTRLADADARARLAEVQELASFTVGRADNPGVGEVAALLPKGLAPLPAPLPAAADQALASGATAVPAARVRADVGPGRRGGQIFRLLGGAAVADAVLFSSTAGVPERPLPSVLDLLVVLGSADAALALAPEMQRLPGLRAALATPWQAGHDTLYDAWLAVLARVVQLPAGDRPAFEHGPDWARHLTVAAAGSWAELRHDTLLYVKQPIVWAEGGHDAELPARLAAGYVEPRPEVFLALEDLRQQLQGRLGPNAAAGLEALGDLLAFVRKVAELELAGAPIPKEVDERLRGIGGELEDLSRGGGDDVPPQALVADVFTAIDAQGRARCLEVGIGDVDELWVVVPRGGKRVLMRGGVFSYYELGSDQLRRDAGDADDAGGFGRLDDSAWGALLYDRPPPRPPWATPVGAAPRARRKD